MSIYAFLCICFAIGELVCGIPYAIKYKRNEEPSTIGFIIAPYASLIISIIAIAIMIFAIPNSKFDVQETHFLAIEDISYDIVNISSEVIYIDDNNELKSYHKNRKDSIIVDTNIDKAYVEKGHLYHGFLYENSIKVYVSK